MILEMIAVSMGMISSIGGVSTSETKSTFTSECKPPENFKPLRTREDLERIDEAPFDNYYLCNDIHLNAPMAPLGANQPFAGIFEGNRKTIYGLSILPDSDLESIGLFSRTEDSAIIQNLKLSAAVIGNIGAVHVGALVGLNKGRIRRVELTGSSRVIGYSSECVGGLVGSQLRQTQIVGEWRGIDRSKVARGSVILGNQYAGGFVGCNGSQIFRSQSKANINSLLNITGSNSSAGGIVGVNSALDDFGIAQTGVVVFSIADADIFGSFAFMAGIAGQSSFTSGFGGAISHSYSNSRLYPQVRMGSPSYPRLGGIVADQVGLDFTIIASYWNRQAFPASNLAVDSRASRSLAEMTAVPRPANTFLGWDFKSIWVQTGGSLPQLR